MSGLWFGLVVVKPWMKRPLPLSRHAFVSLLALAINQVSSFALSPTAAALPRTLRRALGAQTGRRSASSGRPGVLQAEMQAQAGGGGDVSAARVELFFKSDSELRSRVRMLSSIGVSAFSIVNKDKSDKLLGWLDAVAEEAPGASVCVHYSLKYNRERFPPRQSGDLAQATYSKFFQYLDKVAERAGIAQPEVLLITGSGPKVPPEATGCLESLAMHLGGKLPPVPVGVAFNPYFEDAETRAAERARLERKLRTGVVDTVWLQFGSSPEMLAEGLEWLRGLGDGMAPRRIVGSMFLPNKVLIAQQKFRPWNGVFLSEEYLSGPGQVKLARVQPHTLICPCTTFRCSSRSSASR